MNHYKSLKNSGIFLLLSLSILSCSGETPRLTTGLSNSKLAICPGSPNCVSSDADDTDHYIQPFRLKEPPAEVWRVLQTMLMSKPRTKIITAESDYLHAECRSRLFGFVDDLEMHLRPGKGIIAVRSASRLGYFDFGVNRKRLEMLRSELFREGLIE